MVILMLLLNQASVKVCIWSSSSSLQVRISQFWVQSNKPCLCADNTRGCCVQTTINTLPARCETAQQIPSKCSTIGFTKKFHRRFQERKVLPTFCGRIYFWVSFLCFRNKQLQKSTHLLRPRGLTVRLSTNKNSRTSERIFKRFDIRHSYQILLIRSYSGQSAT